MKILVTGGAGYVGSHLVEKLVDQNDVVVLDDLSTGHIEHLPANINFIKGSITNKEDVALVCKDVDQIMHLAAIVSVSRSMQNPAETLVTNTVGTVNLLEENKEKGIPFLYVSSAAVYGDAQTLPIKEDHQLNPKSPYGASKFASEKFCDVYRKNYDMDIKIARPFNIYGGKFHRSHYPNVLSKFWNNIKENKPLTIFGDGNQTRDYIHVSDVCDGFRHLIDQKPDTYNLASGEKTTIREAAEKMRDLHNKGIDIYHKEAELGQIIHSYADISKIKNTGWKPKISFENGLKQLFEL